MTDEKDLTPSKGIPITDKPLLNIIGDSGIKDDKKLIVIGGVSGVGKSTKYMEIVKHFQDNPLAYNPKILSDLYEDIGKSYPEKFEQLHLGEWYKSSEEHLKAHHTGKGDPNGLRQRFNRNGGKW